MCAQPQKRSPSGVSWALSRRQLLQAAVAQAVSLPLLPWLAAEEAVAGEPPAPLPPLNRFPRMVQEYFVAQVRAAEAKGLAAKRALQTKADAEAYVRAVQAKIRRCFGPEPERTPLNPRVTGVVERDAYRIEKDHRCSTPHNQVVIVPPPELPVTPICTCLRVVRSACPAWSERAGIRPTARRRKPINPLPKAWRAWDMPA